VPAAFNNLVGLKPTRGLLSTRGVVPACRSLDCVSIFTRTVAEAARVLAVAAVYDPADPFSRIATPPVAEEAWPPRVGVPRVAQLEFFGNDGAAKLFAAAISRSTSCRFSRPRDCFTRDLGSRSVTRRFVSSSKRSPLRCIP
jgi:allophanate hydrolase